MDYSAWLEQTINGLSDSDKEGGEERKDEQNQSDEWCYRTVLTTSRQEGEFLISPTSEQLCRWRADMKGRLRKQHVQEVESILLPIEQRFHYNSYGLSRNRSPPQLKL